MRECVCTYPHSLVDPWLTQSRHHTHTGTNPLCSNTLRWGRTAVSRPHTHQHLQESRDKVSEISNSIPSSVLPAIKTCLN